MDTADITRQLVILYKVEGAGITMWNELLNFQLALSHLSKEDLEQKKIQMQLELSSVVSGSKKTRKKQLCTHFHSLTLIKQHRHNYR
jgi:hypothetical protein